MAPKLMLLDTYGLVYRAFFALPPLTTTRGMPINAAYGFTMMLNKLVNDEKPTHVIADANGRSVGYRSSRG